MLLPRVLIAVIGVPLILLAVYFGGPGFAFLVWGIAMLCLYEAFDLFKKMGLGGRSVVGFFLAIPLYLVFIVPSAVEPKYLFPLKYPPVAGLALTLAIVTLTLWELFHVKTRSLSRAAVTLFAILLTVWPLAHLVLIRDLAPWGRYWCYLLFITIWVTDTCAYFAGTAFGRKQLAPRVSPKKTIEGFLGGLFGGCLAASLIWLVFFRKEGVSYQHIGVAGLGVSLMGQLSDLVESMLKREAKVKDSSDVIPGHGGVLDRFDSFLLTAPMLYYYAAFAAR